DFPSRFREAGQPFAVALEDQDAQLVLELADLPADARLGGEERVSDLGQVESPPDCLAHRAQLLEVHALTFISECCICLLGHIRSQYESILVDLPNRWAPAPSRR